MKRKRKLPARLKIFFGISALLLFSCICFAAAFALTSLVYQHIGHKPGLFIVELINTLITFLIFGLLMNIFARIMSPKRMQFLNSMIEAMRKMAQGDFNVHLDAGNAKDNPFHEFVESMNHMALELGQMEQLRQEFISNVSHELQSPLTSISGFAGLLQSDDSTSEEHKHYLQIIEMESNRLSKLSENLLKLTSLESSHHPFEPKVYRVDKQIRNIVLSLEPLWAEKKIELDIALPETEIFADEDLMSQVWINLIHNGVKFSPSLSRIQIESLQNAKEVIVRIKDMGIGISEADLPHIFERFYKADKSRTRSAGGSGLGLSIVKKIVDMHHGEIEVQSETGRGTSFTIHLPHS